MVFGNTLMSLAGFLRKCADAHMFHIESWLYYVNDLNLGVSYQKHRDEGIGARVLNVMETYRCHYHEPEYVICVS